MHQIQFKLVWQLTALPIAGFGKTDGEVKCEKEGDCGNGRMEARRGEGKEGVGVRGDLVPETEGDRRPWIKLTHIT